MQGHCRLNVVIVMWRSSMFVVGQCADSLLSVCAKSIGAWRGGGGGMATIGRLCSPDFAGNRCDLCNAGILVHAASRVI